MPPTELPDARADLLRRLRCAEGHLRGIAGMIERGEPCDAVLRQTAAVQAAIREVDRLLIRRRLADCLARLEAASDPAAQARCLDDVLALFEGTR